MKRMNIFRKAKEANTEGSNLFNQYVAGAQRRVADYLNEKTKAWSVLRLKVMLLCFCFAVTGFCSYIAVKAIFYGNGPPASHSSVPQQTFLNKHHNN